MFILCVSGLYDEDVYLYYGDTIKLTLGNLFFAFYIHMDFADQT